MNLLSSSGPIKTVLKYVVLFLAAATVYCYCCFSHVDFFRIKYIPSFLLNFPPAHQRRDVGQRLQDPLVAVRRRRLHAPPLHRLHARRRLSRLRVQDVGAGDVPPLHAEGHGRGILQLLHRGVHGVALRRRWEEEEEEVRTREKQQQEAISKISLIIRYGWRTIPCVPFRRYFRYFFEGA